MSIDKIHWFGHDTFRLDLEKVIWIDPYKLGANQIPADLVLISHDHFDHYSAQDLAQVQTSNTVVITCQAVASKISGSRAISSGQTIDLGWVKIEAVPAYNINKFKAPGQVFHPKSAGYLGFIITPKNGKSVFFAGDSDFIPEHSKIKVDIALLPVSGIYVMTVEEAIEAANVINPEIAVPMHVGKGIGEIEDQKRFLENYKGKTMLLKLEI